MAAVRSAVFGELPKHATGTIQKFVLLAHPSLPRLPAQSGAVCAVMRDAQTGFLHAGADPRREAYALAW